MSLYSQHPATASSESAQFRHTYRSSTPKDSRPIERRTRSVLHPDRPPQTVVGHRPSPLSTYSGFRIRLEIIPKCRALCVATPWPNSSTVAPISRSAIATGLKRIARLGSPRTIWFTFHRFMGGQSEGSLSERQRPGQTRKSTETGAVYHQRTLSPPIDFL
jgi:hypothetical protein